METRRIRALASFTEFTPAGMVVFNPAKKGAKATEDSLPAAQAQSRVDAGQAEYVDQIAADGHTRRALPHVALDAERGPPKLFDKEHLGFGKYRIIGPGVAEGTIVKGKADADTMIDELAKAYAEAGSDAANGAADDEAPAA